MAMTSLLGRSSSLRTRGVSALLATTSIVLWSCQAPSVLAQRIVEKIESRCPLGYVDTLNGKCSTLGMKTHVRPSHRWPSLPIRMAGCGWRVLPQTMSRCGLTPGNVITKMPLAIAT